MRIYVASSWKNAEACRDLAATLRAWGHEVDCFCEEREGRYVFHWSEISETDQDLDAISFLADGRAHRAFREDKGWLDWCDAVVMLLPCGRSAHLEAGYAVGRGKRLVIVGEFPRGEWDVMYGFADDLVRLNDLRSLRRALQHDEAVTPEPIHEWFELTYAQYLTIPRSALQSMPTEWQRRFVDCLDELDARIDWRPSGGLQYWVQLRDTATGAFVPISRDPLMDYARGRRRVSRRCRGAEAGDGEGEG